jgi:hypothetical protein
MGVSYDKHRASRAMPWPRYRVSFWGTISLAQYEVPRLYYSPASVLAAAKLQVSMGETKVRICTIYQSGKKVDMPIEEFEGIHGKAEGQQ